MKREKLSEKPSGLGKALKEASIAVLVIAILIGGGILVEAAAVFTDNPAVFLFGFLGIIFLAVFIISLSIKSLK